MNFKWAKEGFREGFFKNGARLDLVIWAQVPRELRIVSATEHGEESNVADRPVGMPKEIAIRGETLNYKPVAM